MHQDAGLHVGNEEIFVIAISERRDTCQRPFLRVGYRNAALLRGGVLFLDGTERQLGKMLQFDLLLLLQARCQLARVEDRNSQ
jgi:hypothetical protein